MSESIKIVPKVIVIPRREVVRHGKRWIIYLPSDYNDIWEEIKKMGKKVKVYIEVVD